MRPEELPVKKIIKTNASQESFTDEELDGIDITGNHMFIHDSMHDSSYPTTKRNSSQGSYDNDAIEKLKII